MITAYEISSLLNDAEISGKDRIIGRLRTDSRKIGPGDTFIAIRGTTGDGSKFIDSAINNEARVIICGKTDHFGRMDTDATIIRVDDTTAALRLLLPAVYPGASQIGLIGITGTNGKTSTAYLIEATLREAGKNPGVIGTIETRYNDTRIPSELTTPGPADLFEILDTMHSGGVDYCVMETSSHALHQDRMAGLKFDCAVFTNLTQDHLDYHHDMQAYFAAKRKLFTDYLKGTAVINLDDSHGRQLRTINDRTVTFGLTSPAEINPENIDTRNGIAMRLRTPWGRIDINSPLQGDFHIHNIMAASGVALSLGIAPAVIGAGISSLSRIPGRMERVAAADGRKVFVDFAHTPDALKRTLETARKLTDGRLITIFGCGGDRDAGKRPIMGRIAEELSDLVLVTSDNPRTENPASIIAEILSGISDRSKVEVEADRAKAIARGLALMQPQDCLIIAGKGHENYQIIGQVKTPFDDMTCAKKYLEEVLKP